MLTGRLLVAAPQLYDPNFDRSVVLMLEHGEEGALGVILNRPTEVDVADPLPAWAPLAAGPPVVFAGGPVSQESAIGLARATSDEAVDGWAPVDGRLGTVDLSRAPDDIAVGFEAIRIFAGYSGWGAGQLEGELEVGAWIVADALPADALSDEPERLWATVLRRQGGKVAWLALYPPDASFN